MTVLVDTSVWSLALRREVPSSSKETAELAELVRDGQVVIIGAIRQELLSGLRSEAQFKNLRQRLRAFPDIPLGEADHEEAAACFNMCRGRGIQGSNTDFLICAVAKLRGLAIFTMDKDFLSFSKLLKIRLHATRK